MSREAGIEVLGGRMGTNDFILEFATTWLDGLREIERLVCNAIIPFRTAPLIGFKTDNIPPITNLQMFAPTIPETSFGGIQQMQ